MAHVPGPEGPSVPRWAAARERFRRAAGILAHVCGLTLLMKRYIEKSRAEEWAQFYLSIKNHSANELLFDMSNFSKHNLSNGFAKLKTLMFIQPKQRSQENLQEIQLCLKKNRSFHSLPNEVQLQLCQTAIYQELEAESMLLRQGHIPLECYLILAGHLKVMSSSTSMNKNTNSEILSEFEEGDFIGEICLLTNTNRPASILCKTDVKLLVISKDTSSSDFMPPDLIIHLTLYDGFLLYSCTERTRTVSRNMQLSKEPPVVLFMAKRKDRLSGSLFFTSILQGRCRIIAQMNCEEISVRSCVKKTGSSTLKNPRAVLPLRGPLNVTGRSLETTVSPRTSFSAARKKMLDTEKPPLQGPSTATCFVEIRVLEQGEVFGLAEALGSSCDLHLYLISEGVECIFIPKNLFLAEASTDFRRSASELLCAYPTEEALREYLVEQQLWNEYKARLLAQQLKR